MDTEFSSSLNFVSWTFWKRLRKEQRADRKEKRIEQQEAQQRKLKVQNTKQLKRNIPNHLMFWQSHVEEELQDQIEEKLEEHHLQIDKRIFQFIKSTSNGFGEVKIRFWTHHDYFSSSFSLERGDVSTMEIDFSFWSCVNKLLFQRHPINLHTRIDPKRSFDETICFTKSEMILDRPFLVKLGQRVFHLSWKQHV